MIGHLRSSEPLRGNGTVVRANPGGQGDDAVALVTLAGVTGSSLDNLIADGNLVVSPVVA